MHMGGGLLVLEYFLVSKMAVLGYGDVELFGLVKQEMERSLE